MQRVLSHYQRTVDILSGPWIESGALLMTRFALAGVFWRSARTKVVEGSWLTLSDTTHYLFQEEYTGVPLPAQISAYLATYGEHIFPLLLVLGLGTRFSAFALLAMSLTIQFFVYPDAWWPAHSLWVAMALVLLSRGAGIFACDALLSRSTRV